MGPAISTKQPEPYPAIFSRFYALQDTATNFTHYVSRKDTESYGSSTFPARTSFRWPAMDTQQIIYSGKPSRLVYTVVSNVSAAIYYQFRVVWKASLPVGFPAGRVFFHGNGDVSQCAMQQECGDMPLVRFIPSSLPIGELHGELANKIETVYLDDYLQESEEEE